jgi:hypothetical protein
MLTANSKQHTAYCNGHCTFDCTSSTADQQSMTESSSQLRSATGHGASNTQLFDSGCDNRSASQVDAFKMEAAEY